MMAWIQRPDFNCHKPGQNFNLPTKPTRSKQNKQVLSYSHTHTHTLSRSLSFTHKHTHTRESSSLSLLHTHTLSLSHTHTHSLSLSLSHTHQSHLLSLLHTHTLSLSLSLSHTHTHTLSLSPTQTQTRKSSSLSLSLSLSHTHTHTHSLSRSLSLSHTHTHTHTHTHSLSRSHTHQRVIFSLSLSLSLTHTPESHLLYFYLCAAPLIVFFPWRASPSLSGHLFPVSEYQVMKAYLWTAACGWYVCVLIMYRRWTTAGHTKPGFSVRRREADAGVSEYYVTAKRYLATQNQDGWERDMDLMRDEPLNQTKTIKKPSKVQLQLHY